MQWHNIKLVILKTGNKLLLSQTMIFLPYCISTTLHQQGHNRLRHFVVPQNVLRRKKERNSSLRALFSPECRDMGWRLPQRNPSTLARIRWTFGGRLLRAAGRSKEERRKEREKERKKEAASKKSNPQLEPKVGGGSFSPLISVHSIRLSLSGPQCWLRCLLRTKDSPPLYFTFGPVQNNMIEEAPEKMDGKY